MSLRDVHAQVQDSLGIKIEVSIANAQSERGRVECKTLFSKIANTADNLPMAKGSTTNIGYEIITPNRLKLGQNNYRSLEGSGIKLGMSLKLIALLERN